MSVIMNGTTIGDSNGSMVYNGVSLTQVIFNGTIVWEEAPSFTQTWSGSSYAVKSTYNKHGLNTSGNLGRFAWGAGNSGYWYGSYFSVDINGVFSSTTSRWDIDADTMYTIYGGYITSGGSIRTYAGSSYGNWITFTPGIGFSGSSTSSFSTYDEGGTWYYTNITLGTSGGLIRAEGRANTSSSSSYAYGAWIALN